jgi:transcriptional regulator with XRE-family HTH domain
MNRRSHETTIKIPPPTLAQTTREGSGHLERFALEVGLALRRARHARGLTLRQVSDATGGRLKPTSIAGYERAERTISLERFVELCDLYRLPPQSLIAEIWRSVHGIPAPDVELGRLERLGSAEASLVAGFIRQIRSLRSEAGTESIVLRAGDLEVLATASGTQVAELAEVLGPSEEAEERTNANP